MSVCQTNKDTCTTVGFKKNVVYATLGLMPNIIGDISYERQIYSGNKSSMNLRLGFGDYLNLNGIAKMGMLSSNLITGLNSSHFEFGFGVAYLFDIERMNFDKKTEVQPLLNLGWRYLKKNGLFVFRIGVGWPECFYTSLGFAF